MAIKGDPVVAYSVRIEASILAKLKVIAERNRRSMNNELVYNVERIIAAYEKENGPIVLPTDEKPE